MSNAIRFAVYEHEYEAMFNEHSYFACVHHKASSKRSLCEKDGEYFFVAQFYRPLAAKFGRRSFFVRPLKRETAVKVNTMPTIDIRGTGDRIDLLRRNAGPSVRDLQTTLGLGSTRAIYKWIGGKCLPAVDNSALLNVTIDDIIVCC